MNFSQLAEDAAAARMTLCRPVRAVRRYPRSATHAHDFYELAFVCRGSYRLMQPGRPALRVDAGRMILLPPGAIHYERYERGVVPRVGWLGFSVPEERRAARHLQALAHVPMPQPDEDLERLAEEILREQAGRPPGWELKVQAAVTRLLVLLMRQPVAGEARERAAVGPGRRGPNHLAGPLMAAAHYLEEHCGEAISIARLAAEQGLSPAYFSEQFRRLLGSSPRRYLITARLNRARRLLEEGRLTHAAIAQECGFYDEAHFSRAFRALTGLAPGKYHDWAEGAAVSPGGGPRGSSATAGRRGRASSR